MHRPQNAGVVRKHYFAAKGGHRCFGRRRHGQRGSCKFPRRRTTADRQARRLCCLPRSPSFQAWHLQPTFGLSTKFVIVPGPPIRFGTSLVDPRLRGVFSAKTGGRCGCSPAVLSARCQAAQALARAGLCTRHAPPLSRGAGHGRRLPLQLSPSRPSVSCRPWEAAWDPDTPHVGRLNDTSGGEVMVRTRMPARSTARMLRRYSCSGGKHRT
jgi:hypothetical protein